MLGDPLPKILNRSTDVDIPRAAWAGWIPGDGAPRQLRRALTAGERGALEARLSELAPAVAPFGKREADRVALALADMYGGFTSMRQGGEDALARVEAVQRLLAPFPAWAVQKACGSIQMDGVWREGKFDRRWPPNDSEIVAAVRQELRLYKQSHDSASALLAADVEEAKP